MKKVDYVIFGGLVVSLTLFLYVTSLITSSQNAAILENQRLIKNGINDTRQNSERIIDNQRNIIKLTNTSAHVLQSNHDLLDEVERLNNQSIMLFDLLQEHHEVELAEQVDRSNHASNASDASDT